MHRLTLGAHAINDAVASLPLRTRFLPLCLLALLTAVGVTPARAKSSGGGELQLTPGAAPSAVADTPLRWSDGHETWDLAQANGALRLTSALGETATGATGVVPLVLGHPSHACLVVAGVRERAGAKPRLEVHSFNLITRSWALWAEAELPAMPKRAVWEGSRLLVEVASPAGGTTWLKGELPRPRPTLTVPDACVVALYLAVILGVGLWCARGHTTSTSDYFLADRGLHWFVGGVTLYATATSALSLIAIPAKSFSANWDYIAANYVTFVGTTLVAFWVIPRLRRMQLVSIYEYMEHRFHPSIRILGSALALLFQIGGRLGIVILLPALVMEQIAGVPLPLGVITIGALTGLYTVVGGFRAVVWTDLMQCFIMLGGAVLALGWIVHSIGVPLPDVFAEASRLGKTRTFNFHWDFSAPTVWAFLVLEVINVLTWPKDQTLMQRVFATRDERNARNSVILMAAIVIPASTVFYSIGTMLFMFYRAHPERFNPAAPTDAVFPMFISGEMPEGMRGLLVAAVMAASMSTLSSGISSMATLVSVDFLDRLKVFAPLRRIISRRLLVALVAMAATGAGLIFTMSDVRSLLDMDLRLIAIIGGGFAAAYGLGLFTRTARWEGVWVGTIGGTLGAWFLREHVSAILLNGIAVGISLALGYVTSLVLNVVRPASRGPAAL